MINVDRILDTLNRSEVAYILIGGMNFLLRHQPVLTFDVDIWINDNESNRTKCAFALKQLGAEWGPSEELWQPVANFTGDWLGLQDVYSVVSDSGPIDIFRHVRGLTDWNISRQKSEKRLTAGGIEFWSLSDEDMIQETIEWAEQQLPVRRNTPADCKANERRLLGR